MRREDFELPQPPRTDRPLDRWVCGNADAGEPCTRGPGPDGSCSLAGPCQPIGDGTSWKCSRPACLGGKCDPGPGSDGNCGLMPNPCIPRYSWHHRRRQWVLGGAALAIACLFLMIGIPAADEPLRPGPLHRSHAQILSGTLPSQRCAACHPAARGSLLNWFLPVDDDHSNVTQTQLCMDCHHATIAKDRATLAHNLTAAELQTVSLNSTRAGKSAAASSWHDRMPRSAVGNNTTQCAACHREHHGTDGSLSALTNHQCQTCHQDRFASFAADHPDWGDWAYRKTDVIAFDHGSHLREHFAASGQAEWQTGVSCVRCHATTDSGAMVRSGAYQETCAACHEQSLRLQAEEGVELFALPTLPTAPQEATAWPDSATGFYDGKISPLTALFLASDERLEDALKRLPHDRDFSRIQPVQVIQAKAAETIAIAIQQLSNQIKTDGQTRLVSSWTELGIPEAQARKFAAALEREIEAYARHTAEPGDLPPRLRYVGKGHADPVLKELIETLQMLPNESPYLAELRKTPAVAACLRCHPGGSQPRSGQPGAFVWSPLEQSLKSGVMARPFTKFSHQPHFNLPVLADCTHCHRIGDEKQVELTSTAKRAHDFLPLGKATCAGCHTASAAGDSCIKCHNYHVGAGQLE